MMGGAQPSTIYVGGFDAVAAELGTPDFYRAKYILVPYGEDNFTPEQANTKAELRALVAEYKATLPGIRVIWL